MIEIAAEDDEALTKKTNMISKDLVLALPAIVQGASLVTNKDKATPDHTMVSDVAVMRQENANDSRC